MTKSKIEWTDRTWNPFTGCTKVSPGCANCYAERWAIRLKGRGGYPMDEPFRVTFHLNRMSEPFKWRSPSKVFVCSMGDLFHRYIDFIFINDIFMVIRMCPQHTFIILTKRPDRMLRFINSPIHQFTNLPNVWLGVSAENQQTADERIPILLHIPAAVRFVSCEPLLGAIDLKFNDKHCDRTESSHVCDTVSDKLNWVICGGESGPRARPMHPDWARSLRDQCQAAGVPFFFKQWGEYKSVIPKEVFYSDATFHDGTCLRKVGKKAAGRLLDGREWNEFPGEVNEEVTKLTKI
jgi:protein gp37